MSDAPVFDVTQVNLPPIGETVFVLKFNREVSTEALHRWIETWKQMWDGRNVARRPLLMVMGPDADLTAMTDGELLKLGLRRLP
jgi:hypothetical protein